VLLLSSTLHNGMWIINRDLASTTTLVTVVPWRKDGWGVGGGMGVSAGSS